MVRRSLSLQTAVAPPKKKFRPGLSLEEDLTGPVQGSGLWLPKMAGGNKRGSMRVIVTLGVFERTVRLRISNDTSARESPLGEVAFARLNNPWQCLSWG